MRVRQALSSSHPPPPPPSPTPLPSRRHTIGPHLKGNRRRLGGIRRRLGGIRRRLGGNRRRLQGIRRRLGGIRRRLQGIRRRLQRTQFQLEGNRRLEVAVLLQTTIKHPPCTRCCSDEGVAGAVPPSPHTCPRPAPAGAIPQRCCADPPVQWLGLAAHGPGETSHNNIAPSWLKSQSHILWLAPPPHHPFQALPPTPWTPP